MLVGCKGDVVRREGPRAVEDKDIIDLADRIRAPYVETSALEGTNVEEVRKSKASCAAPSSDISCSADSFRSS